MIIFQIIEQRVSEKKRAKKEKLVAGLRFHKEFAGLNVMESEYEVIQNLSNKTLKYKEIFGSYNLTELKKEYIDIIETWARILSIEKKHPEQYTKEDIRELIADICSLIYSEFELVPEGTYFLIFGLKPPQRMMDPDYPRRTIDCDLSALVVRDVLKLFGINAEFAIVQSKESGVIHALLKCGDEFFETTSRSEGLEDLIFYSEKEFKKEYPNCFGIFKSFDIALLHNKTLVELNFGLYEQGIEDATKAIELYPEYGPIHNIRAHLKVEIGDYDGALADAKRAIELSPNNPDPYNLIGYIECVFGNYENAIKYFDMAIRLSPEYIDAYYNRGNAKLRLGDKTGYKDINMANRLKEMRRNQ